MVGTIWGLDMRDGVVSFAIVTLCNQLQASNFRSDRMNHLLILTTFGSLTGMVSAIVLYFAVPCYEMNLTRGRVSQNMTINRAFHIVRGSARRDHAMRPRYMSLDHAMPTARCANRICTVHTQANVDTQRVWYTIGIVKPTTRYAAHRPPL